MYKQIAALLVLSVSLTSITYAASYGGGSGTPENPYQIGSLAHWQTLMNTPEDWGSSFILTTDLNWDGLVLTPVGNNSGGFTGDFNGNGHIIRNAVINQPNDNAGLFGFVHFNAQIRNLGLENLSITGNDVVGGLVGDNHGTLKACYAKCTINGNKAGGLAGLNFGSIINCYSQSSVKGSGAVGGLVASDFGSIISCYASGSVLTTGDANFSGGLFRTTNHWHD